MDFKVGTAIVTPMNNGAIDFISLSKILQYQYENSIDAIVSCGTTGEISTLKQEEYEEIVKYVVDFCRSHFMKSIVGIGGNCTQNVVKNAEFATKVGADCVLAITPYYNKPTQEGLHEHFCEISKSTNLPIMLYNVPGRTSVDLKDETILRIAERCINIRSIKDSTGDLSRIPKLIYRLWKEKVENFHIYAGDDINVVGAIAMGAVGLISVASNVFPKQVSQMVEFCIKNEFMKARNLNGKLTEICELLFSETSPSPVKYCMYKLGFCANEVRLPLAKISKDLAKKLEKAIEKI